MLRIACPSVPFSLSKTCSPQPAEPAVRKPKRRLPSRLTRNAALRFSRGLDARDRGDAKAARAELEAVLKEHPDFGLAADELAALAG